MVLQHERTIVKLNSRINELERRLMERNIIFTGIKEKQDENTMMEAQHFFRAKLKTEHNVPIMEAVRIGVGKNRSMLVTLPHRNKKPQLNAKINKLKEARNEDVKKYLLMTNCLRN